MKLVFATGNIGKLREASEILGEGFELVSLAQVGMTEDIPETGKTLRANSLQKAQYLYDKVGCDCFADDTGKVGVYCRVKEWKASVFFLRFYKRHGDIFVACRVCWNLGLIVADVTLLVREFNSLLFGKIEECGDVGASVV